MKHYIESLWRCKALECGALVPGHGEVIADPARAIDWIISHRLEREAKVLAAVDANPDLTTRELVPHVYQDVSEKLYPLAERSLLAHILKLEADGVVQQDNERWRRLI
jgi:hypothetical protein